MLVITRKAGEKVVIDGIVTVEILGVRGKQALIGITAPQEIPIAREEIYSKALQLESEPKCGVLNFDTPAQTLACA